MHWAQMDSVDIASLVRRGECTAGECVAAALGRIEEVNPALNAVVQRFDVQARHRARANDLPLGLLAGVPLLLKDSAPFAGHALREGSRWHGQRIATTTSPWVLAMEAQGAICLGKTNMPEFGLMDVTEPLLHGPTLNPWNKSITVGGSSGGAAAAVASAMVPVAHATDAGGSIRYPASCCGLFGFKPSRGVTGPITPGMDPRTPGGGVTHVLTRTVRDSALFLAIAEAANAGQPETARTRWVQMSQLPRLRIAVIERPTHGGTLAPAHRAALRDAADLLLGLGHQIVVTDWPSGIEQSHAGFFERWAFGANAYWRGLDPVEQQPFLDNVEPLTRGLIRRGARLQAEQIEGLVQDALGLERAMVDFYARADVLLTPVSACHPVRLGQHHPAGPFEEVWQAMRENVAFTFVQNVTGQPAMSVPLHWTEDGLPVGVQIASKHLNDTLLLQLAYELEQARPWRHRQPPLPPNHP